MSDNLWMEFSATVDGGTSPVDDVCGLCGNRGLVAKETITPAGFRVYMSRRPCICPNGRAIKGRAVPTPTKTLDEFRAKYPALAVDLKALDEKARAALFESFGGVCNCGGERKLVLF